MLWMPMQKIQWVRRRMNSEDTWTFLIHQTHIYAMSDTDRRELIRNAVSFLSDTNVRK